LPPVFLHFGYFADPQAINILKRWVSSEYVRYQASREDISLSEKAELISQAQNIEFKSWRVRGKPERIVFRIEVAPNPAQPPNTPNIRYFRLDHSLGLGWAGSIPKRADAVTYFLALFMV